MNVVTVAPKGLRTPLNGVAGVPPESFRITSCTPMHYGIFYLKNDVLELTLCTVYRVTSAATSGDVFVTGAKPHLASIQRKSARWPAQLTDNLLIIFIPQY